VSVTRWLVFSVLVFSLLVDFDVAADGLFSATARPGEPLLGRRVPMVRDLQDLSSGRALLPHAIRRLARHGPAFPTRERLLDRLARERSEARREVLARELLRIGDGSFESTFVSVYARAGSESSGILARALAFYATSRSVEALVRGLGRSQTAAASEDALVSLGGRAISALLDAAANGARAPGVYRALGRLGDTRARSVLAARSGETDAALARAASMALFLLDPAAERAWAEATIHSLEGDERRHVLEAWLAHDPGSAAAHLTDDDLAPRTVGLEVATSGAPDLERTKHRLLDPDEPSALAHVAVATSPEGRQWLLERPAEPKLIPTFALAAGHAQGSEEREVFLERVEAARGGPEPLLRALFEPSPSPVSTRALFRGLEEERSFPVSAYLLAGRMRAVGLTARERYRAALRAGLRSTDVRVRFGACMALGAFGDDGAGHALARALEDEEPIVRIGAASALVEAGIPSARRDVRLAIRTELDVTVRRALEAVLAGHPEESALGRAIFGARGAAFPNAMILFTSGSAFAY
jgi:hypothetical protein